MQVMKFELNSGNLAKFKAIASAATSFPQAVRNVVSEFGVSEGEARALLAKDEGPGAKLYRELMSRPYTGRE